MNGEELFFSGAKNPLPRFLELTGISNLTIIAALDTLYSELVNGGFWNDLIYLYPFAGSTYTNQRYNYRVPDDYILTQVTGANTHNANGYIPSSATNFLRTNILSTAFNNNFNTGMYLSTEIGGATSRGYFGRIDGVAGSGFAGGINLGVDAAAVRYVGNNTTRRIAFYGNRDNSTPVTGAGAGNGLLTFQRNSGTLTHWRNGSVISTQSVGVLYQKPTFDWWGIGNICVATGAAYESSILASQYRLAYATNQIWDATQQASFYSIVQNFQTALGRAV
jgi:hypothetical protein